MPIVDKKGSPVGWLDWSGIIQFFVDYTYDSKDLKTLAAKSTALNKADLERLMELSASHSIAAAMQASRPLEKAAHRQEQRDHAPLRTVQRDTPLRKALKFLSKGRQHQLPVLQDGKLVAVLSQRDVLRFFSEDFSRLGDVRSTSISALNLGSYHVTTVRETDLAIDAFYLLARNGFTGAAVVNADGVLVNNLSVADMHLVEHDFSRLQKPVSDFVRWQIGGAIVANASDSLEQVMATLQSHHIRRLFLVNQHRNPTAIITLTDICALLFSQMAAPKKDGKKKNSNNNNNNKNKGGDKWKKHMENEAAKKGGKKKSKK